VHYASLPVQCKKPDKQVYHYRNDNQKTGIMSLLLYTSKQFRQRIRQTYKERIRVPYRKKIQPVLVDYKWLIIFSLGIVTIICGMIGFNELNYGKNEPWANLFYRSLQLIFLRGGDYSNPTVIWELEFARFMAPFLFYFSFILIIIDNFKDYFQRIQIRLFVRSPVVICGLGYVGPVVCRYFLDRGEDVVIIEKDPKNPKIRECMDAGAMVIVGDATSGTILARARVMDAKVLFAVTGDDKRNQEIIVHAQELLMGTRRKKSLSCFAHIVDPDFYHFLRPLSLQGTWPVWMNLDFINIYQNAVACLIAKHPPFPANPDKQKNPHPLIIGFGNMGKELLVQIAKSWGQTRGHPVTTKIPVSVIDRSARMKVNAIKKQYPSFADYCSIEPLEMEIESDTFIEGEFLAGTSGRPAVSIVYICLADESLGINVAMELGRKMTAFKVPVIIRMVSPEGFGKFFNIVNSGLTPFSNLIAFPLTSCESTVDYLVHGTNERIAEALHRKYVCDRITEGKTPETDPSLQPWNRLPDSLKMSNQSQAENIRPALQSVGLDIALRTRWDEPLFDLSPFYDILAMKEHERFVRERRSAGWTDGPRDPFKRTSPYLGPWESIPPDIRKYDRDFVVIYPEILAGLDLKIVRLGPEKTIGDIR
jgi:hypothetical protein